RAVGPAKESAESLVTFTLTQTGSTGGLTFATAPAINVITGNLTYRTAPDANRTATFSVTLRDDGPGTPPDKNTSAAQTFTITINPINDPPTFNLAGNPAAVNEDVGPQTVTNFATAMSVGPANESTQALVGFTVTQ